MLFSYIRPEQPRQHQLGRSPERLLLPTRGTRREALVVESQQGASIGS